MKRLYLATDCVLHISNYAFELQPANHGEYVVFAVQNGSADKITVPFLYIMPETPLYSMVTANYIKEHVKGGFVLEKDFSGTSHNILMQKPHEVAERVKDFMAKY